MRASGARHVASPAVSPPARPMASLRDVAAFYAIAFAIAWPAWGLMALVVGPDPPGVLVYVLSSLGGLSPLLALAVLQRRTRGRVSLRAVLGRIRWRGAGRRWWPVAVFGWPAIVLVAELVRAGAGLDAAPGRFLDGPAALGWALVPVVAVQFVAALVTSPLFEEPGWRGFALVPLQARFGRLGGSAVVALAWWTWHQPMNMAFGQFPTPYHFANMVALSFAIDALFRLAGDDVFVAMLAHQSMGTVLTFLWLRPEDPVRLALLVAGVVVLRVLDARHVSRGAPRGSAPRALRSAP